MNLVGPGSPNPVYQLQSALRERGVPMGLVRVTNEHAAVRGLDCPLAIFRVKGAGRAEPNPMDFEGRRWTGGEWWRRWRETLLAAQREPGKRTAYTAVNECIDLAHLSFWLRFYPEMGAAARADGVTVTFGNFAAATFAARDVAQLVPLAQAAVAQGHIMSGNVYWWDDAPERFAYLRPLMDAVPGAEWVIEELGWAENDAAYQGYMALRVLLARWRSVYPDVDAAVWAFNGAGGGWGHSDVPVEDLAGAIAR